MKITHIIESSGGSADFVLYLIKYLPEHHHQVIYSDRTFGGRFEQVKTTYSNVSFYHWKNVQREIRFVKDLKAAVHLYRMVKKMPSDVIHLHSSKAGFLGRLVCFLLGRKNVIYTPNGLAFLRKDVSAAKNLIYVWLEKFAAALNGKVVSCSKSEADALIAKGIHSTYVNNGTEIFETQPSAAVADNNDKSFVVVTTGRVTIQKNPTLFQAIAKHFESDTRFKFMWIGSGELEHLLSSKNIAITGWVPRSEVNRKLEGADVYISTALWEGLPFAVLEAMNLKLPLVLTNCVGNIDLVEPGKNGFLFSTEHEAVEKIKWLFSNRDLLAKFGDHSQEMIRKFFDVRKMAKEYLAIYETVLV